MNREYVNFSNKENSCVGRGEWCCFGVVFFLVSVFFLEFEPVLIEGGGGSGVDKLIKVKLQNLFSSVLFILLNGESG